jgi:hypothetical protein
VAEVRNGVLVEERIVGGIAESRGIGDFAFSEKVCQEMRRAVAF